jgi:hypothetical protein
VRMAVGMIVAMSVNVHEPIVLGVYPQRIVEPWGRVLRLFHSTHIYRGS